LREAVTGLKADVLAEMPRVVSLASSALAVPGSGWQGQEAYPEPAQKAGLLAARLAKNHPLPDGNKRAAWLAMIEFLERNGYQLEQPEPPDAVNAMLGLASSALAEADFVEWPRPRLTKQA
jgi:death-on-curing protein